MAQVTLETNKKETKYQRWNLNQRIQHIVVFVTFTLCSLTGLPIKFYHNPVSEFLVSFFGGIDSMLNWHLASGAAMIAISFWHLIWMAYRIYKGDLGWAIVPNKKDWEDIKQHFAYQLGKTDKPAEFGRYSYKEKFDYWAVFWGMFIIGGSGVIMWFPEWGASFMPRWMIDAYQIGHSDEAVLAIMAIFVWHFYNVHFSPDFFPGSMTWWSGKMTEEVMAHEHPYELKQIQEEFSKRGVPLPEGDVVPTNLNEIPSSGVLGKERG